MQRFQARRPALLHHSRLTRLVAILCWGSGLTIAFGGDAIGLTIVGAVIGYPIAALGVALFALDVVLN
jgi:hypothetical protein